MTEQQGQEQSSGQQQQQQAAPPWGDDANFNPEKAWSLIQNLRGDLDKLKARPVLDEAAQQRLAEYDKIVEANKSDLEKAQGELTRWQTEAETWRGAAVASTVRALAASEFADPDDAVRSLDPAKYLDAGGTIDEKAIKADLDRLLDAKPHYRRQDEQQQAPRVPRANPAQGSSGAGRPADPANELAAILQNKLIAG